MQRTALLLRRLSCVIAASASGLIAAPSIPFQHHTIDTTLPISADGNGDYGLTALVDLDNDGDLDFVLGGRPTQPHTLYWYEFQGPGKWARHLVGTNYLSDVGLAALDVDRDGWVDLICSGVWYRNPATVYPHRVCARGRRRSRRPDRGYQWG